MHDDGLTGNRQKLWGSVTLGGSNCPLCATPARQKLNLSEYQLFRCNHCGCWSSNAAAHRSRTTFEPVNYFQNDAADNQRWREFFRQYLADDDERVALLDLGCGTGAFLKYVAEHHPQVRLYGIELDPTRASMARAQVPSAHIYCGLLEDFAVTSSIEFELITLWDVFEHLPQPREYLEILRKLLKANGTILIQTIYEHSLLPSIGRLSYYLSGGLIKWPARRTHDAHHLAFFTKHCLERLCRELDLTICSMNFDHLAFARTDGAWWVRAVAAGLMNLERCFGHGLFITLAVKKSAAPSAPNGKSEERERLG